MVDEKIVMPGQEVGTEEEFVSGSGSYVQEGITYATLRGRLVDTGKVLTVEQKQKLSPLKVGITITGAVDNIAEPVALVIVEGDGGNEARYPRNADYCILHASRIKRGYVKNVRDEIRIGDIIRAKIVEEKNGEFHISTEEDDCGVLKAFCCACRHALVKKPTGLECSSCGRRENRKVSKDYANVSHG
jgi:exosome complex component CSL4